MSITIGEHIFATQRPDDLEAKLIAATGCNAAELSDMLGRNVAPFQVARALHPFMADDVPIADLTEALAHADLSDVVRQARALLAPPPVGEHAEVTA